MDFGDRPPSFILFTRLFKAALLMESSGKSPMLTLIHFSRAYAHVARVDGATGLRLRLRMLSSHVAACSRKVTQASFDFNTTLSKYSCVSTPLATMISLAVRSRSEAESLPGPDMGQILARSRCRFCWPSTSFQYRTTYHLPSF